MNKYMLLAIKEAEKGINKNDGGPFGCVIIKDGEILAKAHNTVVKDSDPTAHGEMNAIRKACKKLGSFDLTGCDLYTTGFPCPMCMGAIKWANIKTVYYGCNLEDTNKIGFRDDIFYKNKLIPIECDRKECLELYDKYSKIDKKTNY